MSSEFKWRKSQSKADSLAIAEELKLNFDVASYSVEQLADVVNSALRIGEIELEKHGASYYAKNVEEWLDQRLLPNTVSINWDDYRKALYRSFRLLIVADIAKTDFGSSRQRDFGQRWTDFTRGFLGEIGIEKFFKQKFDAEIDLDESTVGDVSTFLPSDIVKIKDNGNWRPVNTTVSIKTSKLASMWLDIGSQLNHSNAFTFIKIGLTVDHLPSFIKKSGILEQLVGMGKSLSEVDDSAKELAELSSKIEDFSELPAYISGFAWDEDFKNGELTVHQTKRKKIVVGGIGRFEKEVGDEVGGLGEIAYGKHLASLSSLRWTVSDWNELKRKI